MKTKYTQFMVQVHLSIMEMFTWTFMLIFPMLYLSTRALIPFNTKVDEDVHLTVPELTKKYGYPCESHQVITDDGYILTLHRLPHGRKSKKTSKRVVFVFHGLLCSSADFVVPGGGQALGYILADHGYDVWLGNARGTKYSRNHTTLDPDSSEYWQFSWHEIGTHDLPATIDYILEKTGVPDLIYLGHSQGTTTFYVLTSMLPEYNKKIRVHFSMAPSGYSEHMRSPLLRILSRWHGPISLLLPMIGYNEFMPSTEFLGITGHYACRDDETPVSQKLCTNVLYLMFGFSYGNMNESVIGVVSGHTPAGCSTKQLLHYGQQIRSGHFRRYDQYSEKKNVIEYGTPEPPDYDLSAITTPVYLMYSLNDYLAGVQDVHRLGRELGNLVEMYQIPDKKFNHIDFVYGLNAYEQVYAKLLTWMDKY